MLGQTHNQVKAWQHGTTRSAPKPLSPRAPARMGIWVLQQTAIVFCLKSAEVFSARPRPLDVQCFQIGHTLYGEIPIHLDEVVLHATGLSRGKDLGPVQAVFSHR